MQLHILHGFRKSMRRGLMDAGYYPDEAMDIVEKLQRLIPDNIRFIPSRLYNVNECLLDVADNRGISRDDAWYLLQTSPELLLHTVGIKTWHQLRSEKQERVALETANIAVNDDKPRWKEKPVTFIPVQGFVPTPPPQTSESKTTTEVVHLRSNRRVNRIRQIRQPLQLPTDHELALIAKKIKDDTGKWPIHFDGRLGLPDTSPAWYAVFASLRDRKTTLAKIVHASFPEINITPNGRFKIAAATSAKSDLKKKRVRQPKPLPSPQKMLPMLEKFKRIEGRFPGMGDSRKHLPDGFPAWPTFYARIRKDYGLNMKAYYNAHKINAYAFNRAAKDSVRKKLFRERLQNSLGGLNLPSGLSHQFISAATSLYDDQKPIPNEQFFDMSRNFRIVSRQNGITLEQAQIRLLQNAKTIFDVHNLPTQKETGNNQAESLSDIITSTLENTLNRQGSRISSDLRERLENSYNAFSALSAHAVREKVTDHAAMERRILNFVFGDASVPRKTRNATSSKQGRKRKISSRPEDKIIWEGLHAFKEKDGRLPKFTDGNKHLPEGSVGWVTIYHDLRKRGQTFTEFYASFPDRNDDQIEQNKKTASVIPIAVPSYK